MPGVWETETVVKLALAASDWPLDREGDPRRQVDPPRPEHGHVMREYAVVICLAAVGVRPEEWERLLFPDLDLTTGTLTIRGVPGGKRATREVVIPQEFLEVMESVYPPGYWGDESTFIVRPDVIRPFLHAQQSARQLRRIADRAGVADTVTWQTLNAGFERRLEAEQIPREEINRLVGRQSKTKNRDGRTEW